MARSLAGSRFSTESAHGPSIMGSEDEVEQSLGRPCPAAGPSGLTNSPHPSSREGHHSTAWWSSGFLLLLMALGAHAVTCLVHLNSVPSTQMRCMMTASRRASATIARFIPRRLAICIAQALSHDHFAGGHLTTEFQCPLLVVKRTLVGGPALSWIPPPTAAVFPGKCLLGGPF